MYVITGVAGFIGSALVAKLNAEGVTDLILVDEFGSSDRWRNLGGKRFRDYWHKNDFLALVESGGLPKGIRGMVHLGACSSTTERDVDFLYRNNFLYTKKLAQYALAHGIRFIYASSAATYGDGTLGYDDDPGVIPSLQPLNPYGFSKQLFDLWALENGCLNGLCGIKFFNVFGPNEYHKEEMRSVVLKSYYQVQDFGLVKLFKSHRPEYKDGEQRRDFIYVKDCCEVLWWLLQHQEVNGIFNLGTGHSRSWNDLVNAVFSALGRQPRIEYIDMPHDIREQYQYFTEAKMGRLASAGCPCTFTPLEDAVTDYVAQYLEKKEAFL